MPAREDPDDITLFDIDPAFQERLLKWLTKYNAVVDVAAAGDGEFALTVDSQKFRDEKYFEARDVGKAPWPSLEDALSTAMGSKAKRGAIDPEFERRVWSWLGANDAHLTFGATESGNEFVVAVDGSGARGEATDIDFEVALAIAEDEWTESAAVAPSHRTHVPREEPEPETLAMPTRHMPPRLFTAEELFEPRSEPETLAAPTRLFEPGDVEATLASPTMVSNRKWTRAQIDRLPDTAFLYVEPGGQKHDGRTHPLSLRHFPYKNERGRVDYGHLKNALGRIPQSALPETVKRQTKAKAEAIFEREFGYTSNAHPMRSVSRGDRPRATKEAREQLVRVMGDYGQWLSDVQDLMGHDYDDVTQEWLLHAYRAGYTAHEATEGGSVVPYKENAHRPPPSPRRIRPAAFDPAAPREHYAQAHHFAVNPTKRGMFMETVIEELKMAGVPRYTAESVVHGDGREFVVDAFRTGANPAITAARLMEQEKSASVERGYGWGSAGAHFAVNDPGQWRTLWPDRRIVSDATIIGWASDAAANGEAEQFDGSAADDARVLDDAGLVTFARRVEVSTT